MCNFCGIFVCLRCKPGRQRPHPLSKDGSGKRYNICVACDNKYLNLQLNHVIYHIILELRLKPQFTLARNRKNINIIIKRNE
jgi:hypothetical protein